MRVKATFVLVGLLFCNVVLADGIIKFSDRLQATEWVVNFYDKYKIIEKSQQDENYQTVFLANQAPSLPSGEQLSDWKEKIRNYYGEPDFWVFITRNTQKNYDYYYDRSVFIGRDTNELFVRQPGEWGFEENSFGIFHFEIGHHWGPTAMTDIPFVDSGGRWALSNIRGVMGYGGDLRFENGKWIYKMDLPKPVVYTTIEGWLMGYRRPSEVPRINYIKKKNWNEFLELREEMTKGYHNGNDSNSFEVPARWVDTMTAEEIIQYYNNLYGGIPRGDGSLMDDPYNPANNPKSYRAIFVVASSEGLLSEQELHNWWDEFVKAYGLKKTTADVEITQQVDSVWDSVENRYKPIMRSWKQITKWGSPFYATTEGNLEMIIRLPLITFTGPEVKNSSGYYETTSVPAWKSPADWQMMSFPFELSSNDPAFVFSDWGLVEQDWQLYQYNDGADYDRAIYISRPGDPRGDIEKFFLQPGKAFWVWSGKKPRQVKVGGVKFHDTTKSFAIKVHSGWNQIGSPFKMERPWDKAVVKFSTVNDIAKSVDINIAFTKGLIGPPVLYLRSGLGYIKISAPDETDRIPAGSVKGNLEPWKGYWFLAKTDGYLFIDPSATVATTLVARASPSKEVFSWSNINSFPEPPAPPSLHIYEVELHKVGGGKIVNKSELLQNFPNPFNPETWIPYKLAESSYVRIRIYDDLGRLVKSLVLGRKEAGEYTSKSQSVYWDGRNESGEQVSSGVYFYTIRTGTFTATRKMIILR